jgi:hypothetical protein
MTSDSATANLSADGMTFAATAEKSLFEGELRFYLRDASAGRFTITFETPEAAIPRLQVEVDVQEVLDVKVNEIMYRPSTTQTTHPEYAIWLDEEQRRRRRDLTGYLLDYGGRRRHPETIIARYGYLVVCRHLEARRRRAARARRLRRQGRRLGTTDGFAAVEDRS